MMEKEKSNGILMKVLDYVERIGNRMPSPAFIFIILSVVIVIMSALLSSLGVSIENPVNGEVIYVENLLQREYLARMVEEAGSNFASFPALSAVLVIMLGIGVAENTGYFEAVLTNIVEKSNRKYILWIIIILGMISNVAGDAGPVVLPPLYALLYLKLGWNPIGGIILAYVTTLGSFAANFILGMSDALVYAFTEPAAQSIIPDIELNVAMNYYFIIASVFILTPVVYFVHKKLTMPQLGEYDPSFASVDLSDERTDFTEEQEKAVRAANYGLLATMIIIAIIAFLPNSFLRNPETGSLINNSPLMNGITIIMAIIFFVPGFIYGVKMRNIKDSHDLASQMTNSMASMASFIVIVFFSSQMMAYFDWSNIGSVMAISGAELLQNANGVVLIVGFIILTAFINMFMGSASAKWALMAPIFVPMFMLLGFHPAFTQMVYRIGDGITNPITPMQAYVPLILALLKKYDKRSGFGTMMSNVLPYSVALFIAWTFLILVWYWLGLPLGPNSPVFLN